MTFLRGKRPHFHIPGNHHPAAAPHVARSILLHSPGDVLILDTETTGLSGEVIELAIINLDGETLYNGRFLPTLFPEAAAIKVHGITYDKLRKEPTFADQYPIIREVMAAATTHLAYNAPFDVARLNFTCELYGLDPLPLKPVCLMKMRGHKVKLGGGHSALSDCLKALELLKELAR